MKIHTFTGVLLLSHLIADPCFKRFLAPNTFVLVQSEHDMIFHEQLFSRRFAGGKIFCGKNYDPKNKDFRFSDQADYRRYEGFSPGTSSIFSILYRPYFLGPQENGTPSIEASI